MSSSSFKDYGVVGPGVMVVGGMVEVEKSAPKYVFIIMVGDIVLATPGIVGGIGVCSLNMFKCMTVT